MNQFPEKLSVKKVLLFIGPGLVFIIALALAYGHRRWQSATQAMLTALDSSESNESNESHKTNRRKTYRPAELADLPVPVQRYFRKALTENQRIIRAVSLEQKGRFNLGADADQWRLFTAEQYIVTAPAGFDWEARIAMLPGISVRVHDAYIKGEGILHASLFGLITLAEMRGTPETAQGEFLRFLAESPWYPTALLPSQGVQWEAVDNNSALATLRDGQNTARMLFRFGDDDLIESVRAEARGRSVGGAVIPTPWEGHWRNYERYDGMLVPREGEVAWILPEGPKPYWQGRITSIRFAFEK